MQQCMGKPGRGAHEASLDASRVIYDTRERLAKLFGAESPKNIVFTNNSTESLNIAIRGVLCPGDHVVTTMLEHNSVLRPLYAMEENGVELTIVSSDPSGNISYDEMEAANSSTHKGDRLYEWLKSVGKYDRYCSCGRNCEETSGAFDCRCFTNGRGISDRCTAMQIDILCFTGHKSFVGPQGTGGMYVRTGLEVRPLKCGGSGVDTYNKHHPKEMPTALEAGTLNGHGIAGLGAAVKYLEETGIDQIREKELQYMWQFYHGVKKIPNVKIYGDFSTERRCPIVTLNIGEYDSSEVSDELLMTYGISTRPGAHCAPLMHEAFGTVEQGAVRFSFSHYNTEEEVETAIQAIRELSEE